MITIKFTPGAIAKLIALTKAPVVQYAPLPSTVNVPFAIKGAWVWSLTLGIPVFIGPVPPGRDGFVL